jgi:hypothetical protein
MFTILDLMRDISRHTVKFGVTNARKDKSITTSTQRGDPNEGYKSRTGPVLINAMATDATLVVDVPK